MADLYFAYGKALLENAISQSTVLGNKEEPTDGKEEEGTHKLLTVRCRKLKPRAHSSNC